MKKIIFIFLINFVMNVSHALEKKPLNGGEYLISSSKQTSSEKIQEVLKKYPPDLTRSLGNNQFFIKYKKDPGIKKLKEVVKPPYLIQLNLPYSIKTP